jgi:hypothetical protein
MTFTCCIYERHGAVPAHKRMRREQPPNNTTLYDQHHKQRREDMGCSAQWFQLPDVHIRQLCISNDVQLNSFSVASFGSTHDTIYPPPATWPLASACKNQPHHQHPKQHLLLQPPAPPHPSLYITCRLTANAQTGRVCSMRIIAARMLRAIASTPRPPNTRLTTSSSNPSAPLRLAATARHGDGTACVGEHAKGFQAGPGMKRRGAICVH